MIVVTVGNRGGHPNRSKWYHNYGYGDLRDYGLEDKKVTVEQLANRHPFIDQGPGRNLWSLRWWIHVYRGHVSIS